LFVQGERIIIRADCAFPLTSLFNGFRDRYVAVKPVITDAVGRKPAT
jgi:hypothetical protein